MSPHVERMRDELAKLEANIAALSGFIAENSILKTLESLDQSLMHAQLDAMMTYAHVLSMRLNRA